MKNHIKAALIITAVLCILSSCSTAPVKDESSTKAPVSQTEITSRTSADFQSEVTYSDTVSTAANESETTSSQNSFG